MKKHIVVVSALLLFVAMKVSAQWQPNPYTSGDISFNGGNVAIGAAPHPYTRFRLTNPPVSTETPGSGGQLAFGTPTAQWWMFRLDSAFNLYLDRDVTNQGWLPGVTFANSGRVGIGTPLPAETLDVAGNILSKGLRVSANPSGGTGLFSGNANLTVVTRIDNTYDDGGAADTSPFTPLLVNCRAYGGGDTAKCGLQFSTANNPTIGTRLLTALRNNGTGASSFYVQNFDGAAWQTRLVVDPAGNVGIGTASPGQRLSVTGTVESTSGGFKFPDGTVQTSAAAVPGANGTLETSGAIKGNSHLGFMPWVNAANNPANGYLKLTTAITDQESNMFSLHLYGYRYQSPEVEAIDIRCSAYAYTGNGLVQKACTTVGTDLPVEITTEPVNGVNYVVVRVGTASTSWYYPHFSVEYDGWKPHDASTFTWKVEATIPAGTQPVNMNNVAIANNDGGSVVVGQAANDQTTRLTIHGSATIDGTLTAGTVIGAVYQDVAEWVPATTKMDAGTVVVLNPGARNEVMPSSHAYDTAVAGVVSAQPGLILGRKGDDKAQIATTGRVKVHVDATQRAVKVGDLLVTSDKPGMAMVSEPIDLGGVRIHRPGTLVGKALEPLPSGEGDVLVLLSLQ